MPKTRPKRDSPSKDFKKTPLYVESNRRLGARVRRLREERGWTLEQAEEHLDFDWKHLGKIERGKGNVTIATLLRIAEAFGRDLDVRFLRRKSKPVP
jgi:transcriptional regulator with XRE-family HTH domain